MTAFAADAAEDLGTRGTPAPGTASNVQLARRPILSVGDRPRVLGYQLLFRDDGLFSAFADIDEARATSEVVSASVLLLGIDRVVGEAKAFITFPRQLLLEGAPLFLPPDRAVIELGRDSWADSPTPEVLARVHELQQRGYAIALADVDDEPGHDALLGLADYLKVDVSGWTAPRQVAVLALLRRHPAAVIATGVDTDEVRETVTRAGVDYVQGYAFAEPSVVEGRDLSGFKLSYLRLLHEAYDDDVDFAVLAGIIKQDVALSYKLLRYVNSAYFGLRGRVESVQQALALLGLQQVRRWVSVATVSGLVDPRPEELAVLASTRARFCESLGAALRIGTTHECFAVGMFSLIHVLLGTTLEEALADLALADRVRAALLGEPGPLRDLLGVVVAYERGRWDAVTRLTGDHGWPEAQLIGHWIDALEWSRDFFGA